MSIELATCRTCGHIVSREYIKGRYQWICDTCNKTVRPLWKEPEAIPPKLDYTKCEGCVASFLKGSLCQRTVDECTTEQAIRAIHDMPTIEEQEEVDIDDFQMRLNCNTF